jgi:hypothetical protein
MVIHNIGCEFGREGKPKPPEIEMFRKRCARELVRVMTDAEVDCLIAFQLAYIELQGQTDESATIELRPIAPTGKQLDESMRRIQEDSADSGPLW